MTSTFRKALVGACLGMLAMATSASATQAPSDNMRLWNLIEKLGRSIEGGDARVFDEWPGHAISMPKASTGRLQIVEGGTFVIADTLRASRSQIRLDGGTGKVRLVDIDLQGRCLSPRDILHRYPDATVIQRPSGHSPDERTYYATRLGSVRVAFGFPYRNPGCLAAIVLDPAARSVP